MLRRRRSVVLVLRLLSLVLSVAGVEPMLLRKHIVPGPARWVENGQETWPVRAALILAKTYDPMVSRLFSAADPTQDLVQARNWYQKARDWGSPEAQRQLDALATYPRR